MSSPAELELAKFRLEQSRYRTDILKWVVVAIGAIVSFAVIDYGKLRLEQFRVTADTKRQLLEAYLKATESPQPDVWKRKLHLLQDFADDEPMKKWAERELRYIEEFAALEALYLETLKVASQLVEPGRLTDPSRVESRMRYNQLYWADLPYGGESQSVISAMVAFRDQLIAAESTPKSAQGWEELNRRLIALSKALRDSRPVYQQEPAQPGGALR
jgi:hypothetical protein